MFDSVFQFLFKYQPLVFEQGRFVLGATRSMSLVALAAAVAALYALWTYRRLSVTRGRTLAVLLALRIPLFALILFVLLRPTLLVKKAAQQQNFVGVLLDDSRSMQIADEKSKPRSEFVKDQFGRVDGPLLTELAKRFEVRLFRFSTSAERLQSSGDLSFEGTGTHLSDALNRARGDLSGLPVAGLVLASDGADTSEVTINEAIAGLRAQGMPVFTVGVGRDRLSRDVQVTRVESPHRVLKGTSLVIDAVVTQTGYAGAKVPFIVEEGGRMIASQDITLPSDGEAATVHVRFLAANAGSRVFKFHVPVQPGEEVPQNNAREALIEVYDRREKILYLEGEPRPEAKFVRQATDLDNNLQIVLLMRTADDKYWRAGIDSPEELQTGFPATREELFSYRGVILGSVEASAFSPDQQRMLEDFIDVRGGGLLAVGGGLSFVEGGWAGTPLAQALPVKLEAAVRGSTNLAATELLVRPTRAGEHHPATQITDHEDAAPAKWRDLPPLTSVNNLQEVKPGATVLLTGLPERGQEQVVLAYQRYGRGKALAMPVQDSWLWRMHSKMPLSDTTHHTFWQRLARWLVDGVPDKVMVTSAPDKVQKGEPVTLTAEVMDPEFKGINDGTITARVTAPSGQAADVSMQWTVKRDGEYVARFTPDEDGLYKVSVGGTRAGKDVGKNAVTVRVAPSDEEYFDAAMRAPLLRRIAEETEGRYFQAANTSNLVEAITYSGKGITVVEDKELWDMPIVLLALLGLMGGEWAYRRARGLA